MKYIFSGDENKQLSASPTYRILCGKILPPTIIVHGTCDSIVPLKDSIKFYELLQSKNLDSYLLSVPYGKHCFNYFLSPRTYATGEVISLYLNIQYNKSNTIKTKI